MAHDWELEPSTQRHRTFAQMSIGEIALLVPRLSLGAIPVLRMANCVVGLDGAGRVWTLDYDEHRVQEPLPPGTKITLTVK